MFKTFWIYIYDRYTVHSVMDIQVWTACSNSDQDFSVLLECLFDFEKPEQRRLFSCHGSTVAWVGPSFITMKPKISHYAHPLGNLSKKVAQPKSRWSLGNKTVHRQDNSPAVFEDSSLTLLKTVHRHIMTFEIWLENIIDYYKGLLLSYDLIR